MPEHSPRQTWLKFLRGKLAATRIALNLFEFTKSVEVLCMPPRRGPVPPPVRHGWEDDSSDDDAEAPDLCESDDESEGDEYDVWGEAAGEKLVDTLLTLLFSGVISAKAVCILCWVAYRAGCAGPVSVFKYNPKAQSGKFRRHIDTALGVDMMKMRKSAYHLDMPHYNKHNVSRDIRPTPVQVLHEEIDKEMQNEHSIEEQIYLAVRDKEWSQLYADHPVVRESEGPVLPLALYVDGVPFLKHETLIGFWVYNLATAKRHLVSVIRKAWMCKCGCRGWCSLYQVLWFIKWSLECVAAGFYPDRGHDGTMFSEVYHPARLLLANEPLRFKMALVQVKGDWAEFASTFGFVSWQSTLNPCLFCFVEKDNMNDYVGTSMLQGPCSDVTQEDVDAACDACEKKRWITSAEQHALVKATLKYDKKKIGNVGRCLRSSLPLLGLEQGDRLEPSPEIPDIGQGFDNLTTLPVLATFWRTSAETLVRHRCPLLSAPGVTLLMFMIDLLHTFYLGVCLRYVARVLWSLISANAWNHAGTADEVEAMSVMNIRAELMNYYHQMRQRGRHLTEVQNLTVSMLGSRHLQNFIKTKAAETKGLVPFCIQLVLEKGDKIPNIATALHGAGEALQRYIELLDAYPKQPDEEQCQLLFEVGMSHLRLAEEAGVAETPKHHLFTHMLRQTKRNGNPKTYSTFLDESLNRVLAAVSKGAYAAVWELRGFDSYSRLSGKKRGREDNI